jgi:hypothetical protein
MDNKGNIIVPDRYEGTRLVEEKGWLWLHGEKSSGFITFGKPVPELLRYPQKKYRNLIRSHEDGLLQLDTFKNVQGIMDSNCNVIIPFVYPNIIERTADKFVFAGFWRSGAHGRLDGPAWYNEFER